MTIDEQIDIHKREIDRLKALKASTVDLKAAVEEAVGTMLCVPRMEICGRVRTARICDARHSVWFLLTRLGGVSQSEIARMYGRDHTTVMSGVRRIEGWCAIDVTHRRRLRQAAVYANLLEV